ncbi:protein turtle [Caerostris extrusa]|uniref:Protein turtle n=1 Tax=Caerostris extrusa TaxID=172846 RepID=A0AAV4SDZ6_CAEEX|nr:protein turtle [Caerostris extrusa]
MELFSEMDGPLINNRRLATPSRTSVTSGSSGHGSKAASLAHSSLQGELDVNNRSGSSSGFVSRNHSAAFHSASLTPNGVPHHNGGSSVFEADSPHSEPALPIVDSYMRPRNRTASATVTCEMVGASVVLVTVNFAVACILLDLINMKILRHDVLL